MCGIFFACSRQEFSDPDERAQQLLKSRGPDSLKTHHVAVTSSQHDDQHLRVSPFKTYLTFVSSVLGLRGKRVHVQPLIDPVTASVFCWNGEAWLLDNAQISDNDTESVFKLLLEHVMSSKLGSSPANVMEALTRITGPYAFVFYDAKADLVYFARDRLGRRSLITNVSDPIDTDLIIVSSLNVQHQSAIEVNTNALHYIDLKDADLRVRSWQWNTPLPAVNLALPSSSSEPLNPTPSAKAVSDVQVYLRESIALRARHVPTPSRDANSHHDDQVESRVAVLFSGGVDCTLLARLAHDILDHDVPIDLLNVAFENPRTIQAAEKKNKTSSNPRAGSPGVPLPFFETCPDRVTGRFVFDELCHTCPEREWRFVAIDIPYTETLAHRSSVVNLMFPHNTEMDLSISLALHFAARGKGMATSGRSSDKTAVLYTTPARVLLSGLGADELFGGYARHGAAFNRAGFDGLNQELNLDISRIGSRNLGRDDRVVSHWSREIRYPFLDENFVRFAVSMPAWDKTGFRPGKIIPRHFDGTNTTNVKTPVSSIEELDPAKMVLRMSLWNLGMKMAANEKKRAIQFGAKTAKMELGGGQTKGTDLIGV